jgi:hypothetical protein
VDRIIATHQAAVLLHNTLQEIELMSKTVKLNQAYDALEPYDSEAAEAAANTTYYAEGLLDSLRTVVDMKSPRREI